MFQGIRTDSRLGRVLDHDSAGGRLIHRIELRAHDYLAGEIGPSKLIRWGRLMSLVEAGAIHGYWPLRWCNESGTLPGIALLHDGS